MLSELARRRELARQQIEQLMHGRDRLLQAFERSRLVAVDVMAELTPLGEPAEYVNLAPTTGPVPLMVPNQRPVEEPPELPIAVTVVETADDVAVDRCAVDEIVVVEEWSWRNRPRPKQRSISRLTTTSTTPCWSCGIRTKCTVTTSATTLARRRRSLHCSAAATTTSRSRKARTPRSTISSPDFAQHVPNRWSSRPNRPPMTQPSADDAGETETGTDGDATVSLTIIEDITVFQASPEAPVVEEAFDNTAFGQRDASLTPIIVACARKLKRVLADEQNEILHTLRRNEPVRTIDTMLPWQTEQAARYAAAVTAELDKAALLGAASIDKGTAKEHKADINRAGATKAAVEALTASIVAPLRERLERAVADGAGDNEELANAVRGLYREWKTQRIDEHLDDVVRAAFGRGALAAVVPGTRVCWMVDPNGPACPDAEDNALAGEVAAGQQFPTGHTCAPAHEGCRCMLALAPR